MIYTGDETQIIEQAKAESGDVWKNKLLDSIKRRIKTHYRTNGCEQCCYCKRDFQDEFNMVIDIEHILPKGNALFQEYMFDIENMNISCKRCNMSIKNDRIDFIVDIAKIKPLYKDASKYYFIHPNFDNYFEHIDYEVTIRNNKKLIKYIRKTDKGNYTYNYFRLEKIEVDTFNDVQGIIEQDTELNPYLPEETKTALEDLIDKL